MSPPRTFPYLVWITACSLLLAAGCAPGEKVAVKPQIEPQKQIAEVIPQEKVPATAGETLKPQLQLEEQLPQTETPTTPPLALKFTPQDSTTYKVITEAQQSVKWRGDVPDNPDFKDAVKLDRLEMTFTQQIQSTDVNGNAVAKITVEGLKYHSATTDKPTVDLDSSDQNDPNNPLGKIIGQSYIIEISTTGEVTKILDVKQADAVLKIPSPDPKKTLALFTPDIIKERHGTLVLPEPDKNQLHTGDSWSNIKTFSFGPMGSSSYEKIYTLKEIKDINNRQLTIAEMTTIPAPETPQDPHSKQLEVDFLDTFDNTGTYTGRLKFDLTAGKVEKYSERLDSKWSVVIPPDKKDTDEPTVLMMGAIRLYDLEKID